jgi:16S rRNA processing protein RimM
MDIDDLIVIGKLGFGQIVKGWVPVRLNPDFQNSIIQFTHLFVIFTDHRVRYATVKKAKLIQGKWYIKFTEPELMLEMNGQTNMLIAIDTEELSVIDDEDYYEPVGMKVISQDEEVGVIIDWFSNNAQDIFVVKDIEGNEIMIPDVPYYVEKTDIENQVIYVRNIEQFKGI